MRVLVTRPMPDGERTAATLRGRGYDVLVAPLMQVKPIAADLSGDWSAVIISSANAVRALDARQIASLNKLPLFAVGQRSADAAREAGFTNVRSANGDAGDLIRLVAASHADQAATYLYLAGEDRAADVEGELAKRGIKARTRDRSTRALRSAIRRNLLTRSAIGKSTSRCISHAAAPRTM